MKKKVGEGGREGGGNEREKSKYSTHDWEGSLLEKWTGSNSKRRKTLQAS